MPTRKLIGKVGFSTLARQLKAAKLPGLACVEDIDYRASRGLDKTVMRAPAKDAVSARNHESIFELGHFRCAISCKAC